MVSRTCSRVASANSEDMLHRGRSTSSAEEDNPERRESVVVVYCRSADKISQARADRAEGAGLPVATCCEFRGRQAQSFCTGVLHSTLRSPPTTFVCALYSQHANSASAADPKSLVSSLTFNFDPTAPCRYLESCRTPTDGAYPSPRRATLVGQSVPIAAGTPPLLHNGDPRPRPKR